MEDKMLTDTLRKDIEQTLKNNKIVIYMKGTPQSPLCGFSARTVEILQSYNQPVKGINILENEEIRQGIKEFTNWPTIPQVFINGEFIGGCDIVTEMHDSGELKKLFAV